MDEYKKGYVMSTEKLQLYKCEVCGNLVQVILSGTGELVCCGQPMKLLDIQHDTSEMGEKHAPKIVFRENEKWVEVKNHPMTMEHYIQFIEVYKKDKSDLHLKYLKPNDTAEFNITGLDDDIEAIENCNIHGLWGEDKHD